MNILRYILSFFKTKPNEQDVYCAAESVIEHISFEVNAEHEWSKGK